MDASAQGQQAPLPEEVYAILEDDTAVDVVRDLMKAHGLPEAAYDVIAPIQQLVATGKLKTADVPKRLKERLALPDDQAKTLAPEITQKLLLPLAPWVPDIAEATKQKAVLSSVVPTLPVSLTAEAFVDRELQKFGLMFPDPHVQERFRRTLISFAEGTLVFDAALDMLVRAKKVGGLELDPAASKELLSGLQEEGERVIITKTLPKETPVQPIVKRTPPPPVSIPPKKFEAATIQPEDAVEVEKHRAELSKATSFNTLDEALKDVGKGLVQLSLSEGEQEKFLQIAQTRLKDVRDAYATRRALEDELVFGGMGLSGARLTAALELIEGAYSYLENAAHEKLVRERDQYVRARQEKHLSPPAKREEPTVSPPPTQVTPAPAPRGRVQDVVLPKRLAGPVDELLAMDLAQFRRLGQTAEASAGRVLETLRLLEEESYGRRLMGIEAWRKSPLQLLYTALLAQSAQERRSIAEVLAAHKKAGEDTLTMAEFQMLVSLNGKMKV
jgi:hypothetical protein